MSTFQGFGTDYRGWSDKRPDGSNTATLWVVILAMPVVPRTYLMWWLLLPLPIYVAVIRRHQRRVGVQITRD